MAFKNPEREREYQRAYQRAYQKKRYNDLPEEKKNVLREKMRNRNRLVRAAQKAAIELCKEK